MDNRIKSIIKKRKQLGWTIKKLAEKSGVTYQEALLVERDGIFRQHYGSKMLKTLNEALELFKKRYLNAPLLEYLEKPWSRKFRQCVKCGTKERKHKGRGLCEFCYSENSEKKQKAHKRKRGVASEKLTKEYLLDEYWVKQKSLNDIAKDCACTRQYVYKKLKQYEISARSKKSARSLALESGKIDFNIVDEDGIINLVKLNKVEVDENFFSSWSNGMAWVLGLIYTDGNLDKKFTYIRIGQKEPELLEKIKKLLKCDKKLHYRKRKVYKRAVSGELYTLQIYNQQIYDDLIRIGLTPDKSLTINFPDIPMEHVRHFIRGCWDGDGSVYSQGVSDFRAKFTSGSLKFIEGMVDELNKAGFKQRKIFTVMRKNPSYYFQVLKNECIKFYHYLYDDVQPELYLERKHKVFEDHFGVLLKKNNFVQAHFPNF